MAARTVAAVRFRVPARRPSGSGRWSLRLAGFGLLVLALAMVAHRTGKLDTASFIGVLGVVGLLAAAGLLAGLAGLRAVWVRDSKGGMRSLLAVLLAAALLVPFANAGFRAATLPMLTDVSTDLEDPPVFRNAREIRTPLMAPLGAMTPERAAEQLAAYPDITGRRYEGSSDIIYEATRRIIEEFGWRITAEQGTPGEDAEIVVEATLRSPVFSFPTDVSIRISEEDTTTYVDMRAAARYGSHDLGDNARHIRDFLKALDAVVAGAAAG